MQFYCTFFVIWIRVWVVKKSTNVFIQQLILLDIFMYSAWTVCSKNCGYGKTNFASQILIDSDSKCPNVICMYLQPTTKGRIMCKYFGNISQLENRLLIGWLARSTNQRPGFQLLMLPKHLHMIRPQVVASFITICNWSLTSINTVNQIFDETYRKFSSMDHTKYLRKYNYWYIRHI